MRILSALLDQNGNYSYLLREFFGVVDGGGWSYALRFVFQSRLAKCILGRIYQAEEVTNLFVWDFFGQCIQARIDFPGIWQASKLATASGLFGGSIKAFEMSANLEATDSTHSIILTSFDLVFLLFCNPPMQTLLCLHCPPIRPFFSVSHVAFSYCLLVCSLNQLCHQNRHHYLTILPKILRRLFP